jgi:hypothetical protein
LVDLACDVFMILVRFSAFDLQAERFVGGFAKNLGLFFGGHAPQSFIEQVLGVLDRRDLSAVGGINGHYVSLLSIDRTGTCVVD